MFYFCFLWLRITYERDVKQEESTTYSIFSSLFLPTIVPMILFIFGHKGNVFILFGQINYYKFSQIDKNISSFGWKYTHFLGDFSYKLQECVENDGDTTKFDNDVVSVLKHTEEWHLLASEVIYGDAGIWVHNDDEFPFHFAVVKEGGEVVIENLWRPFNIL